ncbi:MAG: hypothetical protein WBB19_01090 [Desulforhopalus sp.]
MFDHYLLRRSVVWFYNEIIRSKITLVTASVTVLVASLILTLMLTPESLSKSSVANYWPRDTLDDYAFLSLTACRLKPSPETPRILLVGTAAMREALELPLVLEQKLNRLTDMQVEVVNFMAGGQSAIEAAALVSEVVDQEPTIVILGVSPSRMSAAREELSTIVDHPRLAFQNQAMLEEISNLGLHPGHLSGHYLFDNYEFFAIRMVPFLKNLLAGSLYQNNLHTYDGLTPQSEKSWNADMERLRSRLLHYQQRFPENIASYSRIIERAVRKNSNSHFILLDIPINPKTLQAVFPVNLYKEHIKKMENFCAINSCVYVNPNENNSLKSEHFYDWSHMSSGDGREIFTNQIIPHVLNALSVKK